MTKFLTCFLLQDLLAFVNQSVKDCENQQVRGVHPPTSSQSHCTYQTLVTTEFVHFVLIFFTILFDNHHLAPLLNPIPYALESPPPPPHPLCSGPNSTPE